MRLMVLSLIFLYSGCSPKVVEYLNEGANFGSFETYFLANFKVTNRELSPEGQEILEKIEREAHKELSRRNYTSSSVNPDLIVRYEIISNQVTDVDVNRYYGTYYPLSTISVRTFLESAILFEIHDRKTNKAVWNASIDLNKYTKKENKDKIIEQAIENLFNTYPYKAGEKEPDWSLIEKK